MERIEDTLQGYINEAKAGRGLAVTRKDLEDAVRQIRMTRPPRPEPASAEEREKRRTWFTPMEQIQSAKIVKLHNEIDALQAEVARLKGIESTLQAKVDNLAGLVRILVHSLRKVGTNSSNIIRAMDYLKRNGLTGSILRSDEPQPAEIPESGGHIESADCWCGPTVEDHPGGTLIIHNQTH